MAYTLIKSATLVNERQTFVADVLIKGERIEKIGRALSHPTARVIEAQGKFLLPGVIDDQVHFREPGLTHKATIYTESRAAVAGGITSFMEMPNTFPPALTQRLLQDKYDMAAEHALANYSFYMGASNDNLDEVMKTNRKDVCGLKIFMGSSTGHLLVDDEKTLEELFSKAELLIAVHCEDEATIKRNTETFREKYQDKIPFAAHPLIRSREACYLSSSKAVRLAQAHRTPLHVLHISTAEETELFDGSIPLKDKLITAEACVHHLWFSDQDYPAKGSLIKWNPAIKTAHDQDAVFQAVMDDKIDIIATDHAPHTLQEKNNDYLKAPSGGPLVQHALPAMLEHHLKGKISLEKLVEKMCHHPAIRFNIIDRGYIREGYFADLTVVDTAAPWTAEHKNVWYQCGWTPFDGQTFRSRITHTFVSGHLAYEQGKFDENRLGQRLMFDR